MKKLVISLVIEGNDADLHEIKGNIINVASEAMVSCSVDEIPETKKDLQLPPVFQKQLGNVYGLCAK